MTNAGDYAYLENGSADLRPHVHDYWGGQTERVVLDRTIRLDAAEWGSELRLPDGGLILLGTATIGVNITWSQKLPAVQAGLCFAYKSPGADYGACKQVKQQDRVQILTDETK